jgi:hypothetical protein
VESTQPPTSLTTRHTSSKSHMIAFCECLACKEQREQAGGEGGGDKQGLRKGGLKRGEEMVGEGDHVSVLAQSASVKM